MKAITPADVELPASDTPRTDAAIMFPGGGVVMVRPELARELERELATDRETLAFYRDAYEKAHARAEALEKDNTRLYEQEALHTESYGIVCAERDRAVKALSDGIKWHDADNDPPLNEQRVLGSACPHCGRDTPHQHVIDRKGNVHEPPVELPSEAK